MSCQEPELHDSSCRVFKALLDIKRHGSRVELYNGGTTNTPDSTNTIGIISNTNSNNRANNRDPRESEGNYYLSQRRMRNYGLFHADGTRRGLDCPEETDYFHGAIQVRFMILHHKVNAFNISNSDDPGLFDAAEDCLAEETHIDYQYHETMRAAMGGSCEGFKWGTGDD